ncbi:MAG: hypothetical protein U0514_00865 [Candidatus Andersenbacteria bacterium]
MPTLFDETTIRLFLLVLFSAFLLFFGVYGLFAIYHALKFGYRGLAAVSVVLFVGVSIVLILATYNILLTA